ncbi:hypothetical protein MP878_22890, partial [Escherichia coli]|nr:hypothetical protein [Escherichia coli]
MNVRLRLSFFSPAFSGYGLSEITSPSLLLFSFSSCCVFRSIRSRIGIEVRSAIRIHSINRELNFFYR